MSRFNPYGGYDTERPGPARGYPGAGAPRNQQNGPGPMRNSGVGSSNNVNNAGRPGPGPPGPGPPGTPRYDAGPAYQQHQQRPPYQEDHHHHQQPQGYGYNGGHSQGYNPPPSAAGSSFSSEHQYSGYPPHPPAPSSYDGHDSYDRPRADPYAEPDKRQRDYDIEGQKIEARIKKERPCRVLFVRNVKYNTDTTTLKEKFTAVGEMKAFFDLVSTRGLIFVTYYDLRTAIRARDELQGFEVANRPIDIHYSLPRDEDNPNRRCDRDRNQGTIRVNLVDSRAPIQEYELDRMFRGFGAIKGIYHSGGDPSRERLLEFFDSRAMSDAFDRMQNVPYPAGGRLELMFDWDVKDIPLTNPPPIGARLPGAGPDGRGGPRIGPAGGTVGGRGQLQQGERSNSRDYMPPPPQHHQQQHQPPTPMQGRYAGSPPPPQHGHQDYPYNHGPPPPPQQPHHPHPQQHQQPPHLQHGGYDQRSSYPPPTPNSAGYGGPPPPPSVPLPPSHQRAPSSNYGQPEYPRNGPPLPVPPPSLHQSQNQQQQPYGGPPQPPRPPATPVQQGYGAPPPPQAQQGYGAPPVPTYPQQSPQAQAPHSAYPPQQPAPPAPPQGDISGLLASLGQLPAGAPSSGARPPVPPPSATPFNGPPIPLPPSLIRHAGPGPSTYPPAPAPVATPQNGYAPAPPAGQGPQQQHQAPAPAPPANYEPMPPNLPSSYSRSSDLSNLSSSIPASATTSPSDLLALLKDQQQQQQQQQASQEAYGSINNAASGPQSPQKLPPFLPSPSALMAQQQQQQQQQNSQQGSYGAASLPARPPSATPDPNQNQVNALLAMLKAQQG